MVSNSMGTTESPAQGSARSARRVRFSGVEIIPRAVEGQEDLEVGAELPDAVQRVLASQPKRPDQKRTVLPDEDDGALAEQKYRADDRGPVRDLDPDVAAKRRATLRQAARAAHASFVSGASADFPEDLVSAEEDDPTEDDGVLGGLREDGTPIPLEPFNLKREREEGYFDEMGTYVEYRLQRSSDAWLDSLPDIGHDKATDQQMARERQEHAEASASEQAASQLDKDELAAYKRRMAALLCPGESVAQAMRRLANMGTSSSALHTRQQRQRRRRRAQQPLDGGGGDSSLDHRGQPYGPSFGDAMDVDTGSNGTGGATSVEHEGQSGDQQRHKKLLRPQQQQQLQAQGAYAQQGGSDEDMGGGSRGGGGGGGGTTASGPLGRGAAAKVAPLPGSVQHGNLDSPVARTSLLEQKPADAQHRRAGSPQPSPLPQQRLPASPVPHQHAGATPKAQASGSVPAAAAPLQQQQRQEPSSRVLSSALACSNSAEAAQQRATARSPRAPPQGLGRSRRMPAENIVPFNKLADYAGVLLRQNDFDIYTKTREQLQREADAAFAGSRDSVLVRPGSDAISTHTAPAAATDPAGVPPGDVPAAVAAAAAAAAATAADDGQDMFGNEFDPTAPLQAPRGAAHATAAGPGAACMTTPPQAVQARSADVPGRTLQLAGVQAEPDETPSDLDLDGAATASASDATATEVASSSACAATPLAGDALPKDGGDDGGNDMQGFEVDPSSGLLYSSEIGFYFDPATSLWCDATSGEWFRRDASSGTLQPL